MSTALTRRKSNKKNAAQFTNIKKWGFEQNWTHFSYVYPAKPLFVSKHVAIQVLICFKSATISPSKDLNFVGFVSCVGNHGADKFTIGHPQSISSRTPQDWHCTKPVDVNSQSDTPSFRVAAANGPCVSRSRQRLFPHPPCSVALCPACPLSQRDRTPCLPAEREPHVEAWNVQSWPLKLTWCRTGC